MPNNPLAVLMERFDLTDAERAFVTEAYTASDPRANRSQVIASLYLAKSLQDMADKVPTSLVETVGELRATINRSVTRINETNEKLEKANDNYIKVTTGLTWAIAAFAAVEAFSTLAGVLMRQ